MKRRYGITGAIRAAADGDLSAPVQLEVECDTPGEPLTFDVLVSPCSAEEDLPDGVVVTITSREPPTV